MRITAILAAAAALAFASPTSAQDILIDISVTPVYEITAPVEGVAGVPSKAKDNYQAPNGEKTAKLNRNQCWVSEPGGPKTAGTQGADQVCIWNNGSLSTTFHGGRPGIAAVDGLYGQGWVGLDIPAGSHPLDFSHEHDLIHGHTCKGSSAPSSIGPGSTSC